MLLKAQLDKNLLINTESGLLFRKLQVVYVAS